jgi:hypothetical protein
VKKQWIAAFSAKTFLLYRRKIKSDSIADALLEAELARTNGLNPINGGSKPLTAPDSVRLHGLQHWE